MRWPRLFALGLIGIMLFAQGLIGVGAPAVAFADTGERSLTPSQPRPPTSETVACSFAEPVCVHLGDQSPRRAAVTLGAAEDALAALRGLGLRPPLGDGSLGGNSAFDLYYSTDVEGAAAHPQARGLDSEVDRVAAFGILPVHRRGPPCAERSDVARVLVQAALLRLDAAVHEGVLALQSSYLASIIAPCAPLEALAVDRVQRAPERPLTEGSRDRMHGHLLWSAFLDESYGDGDLGAILTRTIAASSQLTPPGTDTWINEPDVFDTLRAILPARGQQLADMLGAYAVARAFVGSRSDGKHIPDTARFGSLGRVRFEWSIDAASLPRRVAPARPVHPTGASYVWLDLPLPKRPARIVLAAQWEESFVFSWVAVRVDAQGREIGRQVAGGVFGHNNARITIEQIEDECVGVLIVGASAGNDDRSQPFDPDRGPALAAAYELSLFADP